MNMGKHIFTFLLLFFAAGFYGQLVVGRDTITVRENNYVLKMPWGNGINSSNVSNIDLNFDGKKDIVAFDKPTGFSVGRFRCFINNGSPGQIKYTAAPDLSYSFPEVTDWAMLLDYNCDSMEDIFCSANGNVMVYKNISSVSTGINFVLVKSILYTNYSPPSTSGLTPLYASSIGVPGIADIDGDGDLDFLTFASGGFYIEYHKNTSIENNHGCDSLNYELADPCWGKVQESNCTFDLNNCSPKPAHNDVNQLTSKTQNVTHHAGSCLTCYDTDSDGDQDIIMGDIGGMSNSCNTLQYAYNSGTPLNALISDTTKMYPNYPNKNNTLQTKMYVFPCAYKVDCDGNGKKDLVATPNVNGSENVNSLWFYKNTSATGTVNFQFVKDNFLQDEMIEVGQNSYPVVLDYDLDGRKDLLIGSWGYFTNGSLKAKLTLYKNIGTTAQPSYSLITRDFANLSVQNLTHANPTIGDIDTDGDVDILVGTSSGQIHWLENTGGIGNYLFHANSFSITTQSAEAAPQLFDIDGDLKLDLMIGGKNGRIAYYKNIGTFAAPSFSLISNFFGSVDVKGNIFHFGIDGYAAPHFFKAGSATKLLVGNVAGQLYYYDVPSILTNSCNLINATANNINEGGMATIYFEDVNNDNKPDLFVGNGSGGLSFFSSINQFVGIKDNAPGYLNDLITLYPNPANAYLNLRINGLEFENGRLILYDMLGKEIENMTIVSNTQTFATTNINTGIYFAKITLTHNLQTVSVTKKIIIN